MPIAQTRHNHGPEQSTPGAFDCLRSAPTLHANRALPLHNDNPMLTPKYKAGFRNASEVSAAQSDRANVANVAEGSPLRGHSAMRSPWMELG